MNDLTNGFGGRRPRQPDQAVSRAERTFTGLGITNGMHLLKYYLLVALSWLAAQGALAESEDELADALVSSLKANDFDPVKFQVAAARMWEYGIREGDCDSLINAEFLWREAWNYFGASIDSTKLLGNECPDRPSPLYYSAGFSALQAGLLEEARQQFEQAVAASIDESPSLQSMAWQALGTVQLKQLDYPEAIASFERAFELIPDNRNPTHLNSLAYVSYVLGQCEKSIEWANLGLEALQGLLEEDDKFQSVYIGDRNALLLTKLQSAMAMGDTLTAREASDNIRLDQPFDGREGAAMNILTRYAQWTNDSTLFASYRVRFEQWIADLDSASVASELGANRGLFAPWSDGTQRKAAWDSLRSLPVAFRGGLPITCHSGVTAVVVPWNWGMVLGWAGALLAFLALGLAAGWMVMTRVHQRSLNRAATRDLQQVVQQAIASDRPLPLIQRRRALFALKTLIERNRKVSLDAFPGAEHWSQIEREVAIGLINGEQSKDIARRLQVSMSTIYNVRHGLRARLKLEDEVMLGPWLRKQAAKGGAVVAMLFLMSFAAPPHGAHRLKTWLEANDRAGWQAHVLNASEGSLRQAQLEVPDGFEVFYQQAGDRPAWASVSDSVLWEWGRSGLPALEVLSVDGGGDVADRFDTALARERLSRLKGKERRRALWWLLALDGLLAVAVLTMWYRGMARGPRFSEEWEVLRDAIEATGANVEAELKWKLLMAERADDPVGHELWELLTSSEQEMARLLGQSIPVAEIAKRMACSPSYVYNLRSQIRQKWQLDAADNLVDFIHRVQSGEI